MGIAGEGVLVANAVSAVTVGLKDVAESWLSAFYSRMPLADAIVDIGLDENGTPVGVWDFGTAEEPFVRSGKIDATRKDVAVLGLVEELLQILEMPDGNRQFSEAYAAHIQEGCCNGDGLDSEVEEDGMARDSGEGVLRSEDQGEN